MATPQAGGEAKHERRFDRLRMKNKLETFLTKEYHALARKECAPYLQAAVKCRDEAGLMTGFRCREEHAEMNKCLGKFTKDEERYAAWKAKRIKEIANMPDQLRRPGTDTPSA